MHVRERREANNKDLIQWIFMNRRQVREILLSIKQRILHLSTLLFLTPREHVSIHHRPHEPRRRFKKYDLNFLSTIFHCVEAINNLTATKGRKIS